MPDKAKPDKSSNDVAFFAFQSHENVKVHCGLGESTKDARRGFDKGTSLTIDNGGHVDQQPIAALPCFDGGGVELIWRGATQVEIMLAARLALGPRPLPPDVGTNGSFTVTNYDDHEQPESTQTFDGNAADQLKLAEYTAKIDAWNKHAELIWGMVKGLGVAL